MGIHRISANELKLRGVPGMSVTSYPVTYCIYVPVKTGNLFSSLLCSLWWVQIVGLQIILVHLYSIIIVQTYLKTLNLSNACPVYFVECVSQIEHILSVIHYTICRAVYFLFTHLSCDDWENIFTLSYYHHQIGSMNYYPLFTVRSWSNVVRCMSFYILRYG